MELLETDDPVKGRLLKKSAMHQKQIEDEVKFISDKTQKVLATALVVGGALALGYAVVSSLSGASKPKRKSRPAKIKVVQAREGGEAEEVIHAEPDAPGVVAQIGTALASQAAMFLLSIAREKLMEYLQSQTVPAQKNADDPAR